MNVFNSVYLKLDFFEMPKNRFLAEAQEIVGNPEKWKSEFI